MYLDASSIRWLILNVVTTDSFAAPDFWQNMHSAQSIGCVELRSVRYLEPSSALVLVQVSKESLLFSSLDILLLLVKLE